MSKNLFNALNTADKSDAILRIQKHNALIALFLVTLAIIGSLDIGLHEYT